MKKKKLRRVKGMSFAELIPAMLIGSFLILSLSYTYSAFVKTYVSNKNHALVVNSTMTGFSKVKTEILQASNVVVNVAKDSLTYEDVDNFSCRIYFQNGKLYYQKGTNASIVMVDNVNSVEFKYYDANMNSIEVILKVSVGTVSSNIDTVIALRNEL